MPVINLQKRALMTFNRSLIERGMRKCSTAFLVARVVGDRDQLHCLSPESSRAGQSDATTQAKEALDIKEALKVSSGCAAVTSQGKAKAMDQ